MSVIRLYISLLFVFDCAFRLEFTKSYRHTGHRVLVRNQFVNSAELKRCPQCRICVTVSFGTNCSNRIGHSSFNGFSNKLKCWVTVLSRISR